MNKSQYISKQNGIMIHCPNPSCGYIWRYLGRFSFYATCPSCRRNIKIIENKVEPRQPFHNRCIGPIKGVDNNSSAGAEHNNG